MSKIDALLYVLNQKVITRFLVWIFKLDCLNMTAKYDTTIVLEHSFLY